MKGYAVVLFHTTSAAIRSEKLLHERSFTAALIPTPRQFSSDCGIALRFDNAHRREVQELLESSGISYSSIHALENS